MTAPRFDFTAGSMPTGASIARASNGGRFDASGAYVFETANVARLHYRFNGVAGMEAAGLYLEPATTNVFQRSNDNTSWGVNNVVYPTTSEIAEDSTAAVVHYAQGQAGATTGIRYVMSGFVAARATGSKRYLYIRSVAAGTIGICIDTVTGAVVGGGTFESVSAVRVTPTLWLWTLVYTATVTSANTSTRAYVNTTLSIGGTTQNGDGVSGYVATHFQNEEGGSPSSRIVNGGTGTTARAAETLSLNWNAVAVPPIADGPARIRFTFDDLSTQLVDSTIVGGVSTVPATLNRTLIRSAEYAILTTPPAPRIFTMAEAGSKSVSFN